MKKYIIILGTIGALLLSGCSKQTQTLPEPIQNETNISGDTIALSTGEIDQISGLIASGIIESGILNSGNETISRQALLNLLSKHEAGTKTTGSTLTETSKKAVKELSSIIEKRKNSGTSGTKTNLDEKDIKTIENILDELTKK